MNAVRALSALIFVALIAFILSIPLRGTEDDKGPIVATLYSMAALRDTGWPLGMSVRLLSANGEESRSPSRP